jgi:hypothetical protein
MKRLICLSVCLIVFTPLYCQFTNIKLDEGGPDNYACEPAIAINLKNPLNIVAASVKNNMYVTFDGGKTWDKQKMNSPFGVYGDPVLVADHKGTFYYFHLSDPTGEGWKNEKSMEAIICQVSVDGGRTWDGGNPIGYNPPKDQDKPWASVDGKGNVYVSWTQFDKYNSDDPECRSVILLSTSSNGKKWSKPVQISNNPGNCLDDDQTTEGAVPAISDDRKVYVAWSHNSKIYLDRSFDGGGMWLSNDIEIAEQTGGWDMKIPGHNRSNGFPVLIADRSKTTSRGLIYIVWADQRNGEDDTDVWFMRSNAYGDYWTTPLKIGGDKKKTHQYMPWMTIDQTTGYLYILYYDRSDHEDHQTDVYLAYSTDAGTSFSTVKISETSFVPTESSFFGDYLNISAHKGVITPIWTRMDEGKTSVMTAVIRQEDLIGKK